MDRNFVALECARRTRDAALSHARIWDGIAPPDERLFDFALIELPKGRSVMRRCLAQAFRALKPGAPLWLAGAKDLGVEPAIKDAAALFGPGSAPIYKKGSRLVNFVRPASAPCLPTAPDLAWWDEPGIAPDTWQAFNVTTPGGTLPLVALPGVFAAGRLDDGTALLLDHLPNPAGLRAVDLGCGAGIIGLRMAQRGAAWVDLLDTDLLAVAACQENLRRLGLGDAAAMPSDALSAVQGREYDLIVSNPPFHSGKEVDYRMAQAFIRQSYAALRPKGRLILVANRFIRYERRLEEFFPHPRFLAETRSFHVIMAQKI
jgi:16S rRNA (guanine1207-N2)-methyltransferase